MTRFLRPRNWDRWQSGRRQQGAPWIKTYNSILSDPNYLALTAAQRGILHGIWQLYSVHGRPLPATSRYLSGTLQLPSQTLAQNLRALVSNDFIEIVGENCTRAVHEREREKERESQNPPTSDSDSPSPRAAKRPNGVDHGFDLFWQAYPRKVGRGGAMKAYIKACERAPPAEIMAGLQRRLPGWRDRELRYIPHAATWLNQDRWTDEVSDDRPQDPDADPGLAAQREAILRGVGLKDP